MKNTKLRVAWIIPNVFCYLMFVGFSTFVALNAEGLHEINRLSIWVLAMIILLLISIFGSYRIWTWINQLTGSDSLATCHCCYGANE